MEKTTGTPCLEEMPIASGSRHRPFTLPLSRKEAVISWAQLRGEFGNEKMGISPHRPVFIVTTEERAEFATSWKISCSY